MEGKHTKKSLFAGVHRRLGFQRGKGGAQDALGRPYPIPKGDTPYVQAKRSEYIAKNLAQAELYYRLAIDQGDRPESAVKDLAGVLVQQGKMLEARNLLERYQHVFSTDISKYQNLLTNIYKQTAVSSRYLKLSGLKSTATPETIRAMFSNPNRIHDIDIDQVHGVAILKIMSHSAARKTIESFKARGLYNLEELPGKDECESEQQPLFKFSLFTADPAQLCYTLPVDGENDVLEAVSTESDRSAVECIGAKLYDSIFGAES